LGTGLGISRYYGGCVGKRNFVNTESAFDTERCKQKLKSVKKLTCENVLARGFTFSPVFVKNAQLLKLLHIQREGRVGLRTIELLKLSSVHHVQHSNGKWS
jgi:hypothetical protein